MIKKPHGVDFIVICTKGINHLIPFSLVIPMTAHRSQNESDQDALAILPVGFGVEMAVVEVSTSLVVAAVDVLTVVLAISWTVVPRVVTAVVCTVVVAAK